MNAEINGGWWGQSMDVIKFDISPNCPRSDVDCKKIKKKAYNWIVDNVPG